MSASEETFEPRYSTVPASNVLSETTRNPSRVFAITAPVSESIALADAGTRVKWKRSRLAPRPSTSRSPDPLVVRSTSATRRSTPECDPVNNRTRIMPPKNTGPRIVPIQNHLVRTRSTNSRRTTASSLRMGTHSPLRGVRAHEVHKDRVQRGSGRLAPGQSRPRSDECFQDFLGVRAGGQLDLRVWAEVLKPRNEPLVGEHGLGSSLTAVKGDDQ